MHDLVLRRDEAGVATLTLNRPDKLNALTPQVLGRLHEHVDDIATDPSVACVVLTGAGRSFCAGHDLEAISDGDHDAQAEGRAVDACERLPPPVIGAIRGHCLTGGLELALACDLLVATESARFADTHATWGLVPVWGMSVRLPERVGVQTAKRLMFTAGRVSGTEAHALGLVDQVTVDDALDEAVASLAAEIVVNSADALKIIKALLRDSTEMPRRQALDAERTLPYGLPADMADRLSRSPARRG
jgi:enoyl-CoA hydratase/carnithine racemase